MSRTMIALTFAVAGFASSIGTPHLLRSAECAMAFGQCLRDDLACHYVGIQGERTVFPAIRTGGRHCASVKLLPLQWPLFQVRSP